MNPDVEEKVAPEYGPAKPKTDFSMNLINSKGEEVSMKQFKENPSKAIYKKTALMRQSFS